MHTTLPGMGSQAFKTRPRLTRFRAGGISLRLSCVALFEHENHVGLRVEGRGRHLERELRNVLVSGPEEFVSGHDQADVALLLELHGDRFEHPNRAEFAHFGDALFHLFVGTGIIKSKGLDGSPSEVPPFTMKQDLVDRPESRPRVSEVTLIPYPGSLSYSFLRKTKLPES